MLADANDVAKRAATLLDDPSNSIYSVAYLMPFIDQCYDLLDVELERAGMQYIESIAVFNIPANTTDLSSYIRDGQPLATMKFPKWIKWKLLNQPDILYARSSFTDELSEVDTAVSYGALQWTFHRGAIQVTPSVQALTLKVYFDEMSTNILDPATNVIRGTAHILASDVAAKVAGARKGMEKRADKLEADHKAAWNAFKSVLVMNNQGKQVSAPPMHPRRRVTTPYIPAPSQ